MKVLDDAFSFLFQNEGGARYVDNPYDSGGPTKYGVTQKAYESYLGRGVTPWVIASLSEIDAKTFYFARYWSPLQCDRVMDPGIAIALFDTGVLYGVGMSAVLAQKALNSLGFHLKVDAVLGDESVTALNAVDRRAFLREFFQFILLRIDTVCKLDPKNERFRRGWRNRADRLLTLSAYTPLNRGDTPKTSEVPS